MSHIVSIETQVRDPDSILLACQRLQLPVPRHETVSLFSATATGWTVRLPEWRYPLVCDTEQGQLHYDNFEGRWGDPGQLHRFLQAYAVETAKLEARKQGYSAVEQPLSDGSIRVTIQLGE